MLPSLVCKNQKWTLHFDGQYLLTEPTATFMKAIQAWFAVFWIFSVEYPRQLRNVCLFLEKYIFGRKTSVPGVVARLADKIL